MLLQEVSHGRWPVLPATLSKTTPKSVPAKWMVGQAVCVVDHLAEDEGFDAEDHLSKDGEFDVERQVEENDDGINIFWHTRDLAQLSSRVIAMGQDAETKPLYLTNPAGGPLESDLA